MQSLDYFSREISIPGIGPAGLRKLQESSVAIVGVGGVGSAAAYYLARSGVGHLKLIDQDIVESTNLQRLHAATTKDLYHPKAEVIADRLSEQAAWCKIEPVIETVTDRNASALLRDMDLIFDGLDNFRTRYILNQFAVLSETPYLFASAIADQAHIALLNPPKTACLTCIMPQVADRFADSCETLEDRKQCPFGQDSSELSLSSRVSTWRVHGLTLPERTISHRRSRKRDSSGEDG